MTVSRRDLLKLSAGSAAVLATGCPAAKPQPASDKPPVEDKPLRVLLVASPDGYADKLQRYWGSQSDVPFELRSTKIEEAVAAKRLKADVVVYPSRLLGELAASERIATLSRTLTDGEELHAGDLLRHARTTEVTWGAATLAVCLGAPTLTLLYRKDLFEKLSLSVPQTWEDYHIVATALANEMGPDAVIEPLGDQAEMVLLARAAAYVRNRSDYGGLFDLKSMKPHIGEAPYVRALEEMMAMKPANAEQRTSAAGLQKLLAGDSALTWGWPTAAAIADTSNHAADIALASLPGSEAVYDFRAQTWQKREPGETRRVPLLGAAGVLASVTTEARHPRAAENFLAWLSAGENAVELAASRTDAGPFRRSHLAQPRPWLPPWFSSDATQQFVAATQETQEESVVFQVPRLPGEAEYRKAIRNAVEEALSGKSATDALAIAAQAFDKTTDRLGRDEQRLAYQRSLGLDV